MVNKHEFIWNMIASIFASMLSVVLLFLITRINGVDTAGMFSIVFATVTILNSIADFGMRIYQVTDTKRKNSFGLYLASRLVVDILMLIVAMVYFIVAEYKGNEVWIFLCLLIFRFIDGMSETYQGEFQLRGRLDIAGKSVTYRMLISLVLFAIVDVVSKNIVVSMIVLMCANIIGFAIYDLQKIKVYTTEKMEFEIDAIWKVCAACFPIFLSTILNNYIINAPKYAIDKFLNYEMQTYFNILYLPTFCINLMSIFVLKPMLRVLGEMWNEANYRKFVKIIYKMVGAIILLTLLVEGVCATIGIPILSVIFGVSLAKYKYILIVLVVSGGLSALAVVLLYSLTTMRVQRWASIAYVLSAISGVFLPNVFVKRSGLMGAAISSVLIMLVLLIVLMLVFIVEWRKNVKKKEVQ